MMGNRIRVLLVDDEALVRQSLALCLSSMTDIEVVAAASTADQAIDECLTHQPDVVLMDIDMPGVSCFEAARTIKLRAPATKIIFLSSFCHDHFIEGKRSALFNGSLG